MQSTVQDQAGGSRHLQPHWLEGAQYESHCLTWPGLCLHRPLKAGQTCTKVPPAGCRWVEDPPTGHDMIAHRCLAFIRPPMALRAMAVCNNLSTGLAADLYTHNPGAATHRCPGHADTARAPCPTAAAQCRFYQRPVQHSQRSLERHHLLLQAPEPLRERRGLLLAWRHVERGCSQVRLLAGHVLVAVVKLLRRTAG